MTHGPPLPLAETHTHHTSPKRNVLKRTPTFFPRWAHAFSECNCTILHMFDERVLTHICCQPAIDVLRKHLTFLFDFSNFPATACNTTLRRLKRPALFAHWLMQHFARDQMKASLFGKCTSSSFDGIPTKPFSRNSKLHSGSPPRNTSGQRFQSNPPQITTTEPSGRWEGCQQLLQPQKGHMFTLHTHMVL